MSTDKISKYFQEPTHKNFCNMSPQTRKNVIDNALLCVQNKCGDILVANETLRFYLYGCDGNLSKNVKRDDDNDFEYKDESYRYLPDRQSSSSSENKNYSTKAFLNKNSRDLGQDIDNYLSNFLDDEDKIILIKSFPLKKYNFFFTKQYDPSSFTKKGTGVPLKYFLNIKTSHSGIINNLPQGLLSLELDDYKGPLPSRFPDSLQTINLGRNSLYNETLPKLPDGLQTLILSYGYNKKFTFKLPSGLKKLILGDNYLHTLDNLPEGLLYLKLGTFYFHELPKKLPPNLKIFR